MLGRRNVPVRIPPNFFGIPLGLSGLAALWVFAGTSVGAPAAVGDALAVLAAVVWIGLMAAYLRQGPRRILADARDAMVGPFLAAPVMSAYALAGVLQSHAPGTARAIVIAFLVIGLLVSGLLTGQWLTGGLQEATFGPAFFLPGIGIGFVGADVALNRMFFRPRLPPALIPTMAIELAPAAVAGNAYFLIHPGPPDLLLFALSGYAVVMVVAQIRLLALYRTLSFTPGFWSFTFPAANMALFALRWLQLEHPAGGSAYTWVLVAAVTVLVGAIGVRTIVAATHGQLLPSPARAPAVALTT
jgi:tellurite resistance protein